jgi:RNA polymerase sigma-70 factor (ECF subfamily)
MSGLDSDAAAALPTVTMRPLTHAGGTQLYAGSRMGTTVHGSTARQRTSEEWLEALRADGARRDRAIADLHALLLRSARFEVGRRRAALSHVRGEELEDVAMQAADDALMAVLSKLDQYRGASRFTTWAYKFALLEAGVRLRRRAWQGREVVLEPEAWPAFGDERPSVQDVLEQGELLAALKAAISERLTSHQRDVFVALALNQVPIDVLAERLNTTRGALYKTLHDARRKLRQELVGAGFAEANARAIAQQED